MKSPRLFANNNDVILRMFSSGIGFGTLTQEVAAAYLKQGKLIVLNGGMAIEETLALVWYPRTEAPLYLKALIRAIK